MDGYSIADLCDPELTQLREILAKIYNPTVEVLVNTLIEGLHRGYDAMTDVGGGFHCMKEKEELLSRLDRLHTTPLGAVRIKRNLALDTEDVVDWCRGKTRATDAVITRKGKNWYVAVKSCIITINAISDTIITAHKGKKIKGSNGKGASNHGG